LTLLAEARNGIFPFGEVVPELGSRTSTTYWRFDTDVCLDGGRTTVGVLEEFLHCRGLLGGLSHTRLLSAVLKMVPGSSSRKAI
jgi:hypothetical protein